MKPDTLREACALNARAIEQGYDGLCDESLRDLADQLEDPEQRAAIFADYRDRFGVTIG